MFNKAHKIRIFFAAIFIVSGLFLASASFAQETGGLKGKVRTASGNGIPNATVTLSQNDVVLKTINTDAKGNFVLNGLASGKYKVLFDARGYSSGTLYNVEVRKKVVRDLGDRLMLTVDRGTLLILEGSVFYKEGTSVTGAKVECEQILPDGSTKKIGTTETSGDGEFRFKMPEGPTKLRFTATLKGSAATKELEVDQAAVYRLAISLDISRTEK
ncbi:MAG: carboxypeptidase regulatory-like domain-containing protein [Pyrinomonadaceae bacterium]